MDENSRPSQPTSLMDRLSFLAFLFGIVFLGLVGGMLLAAFDSRAYALTEDAVSACRALMARQTMSDTAYLPWLWQPVQHDQSLLSGDRAENEGAITLYTSGGDSLATLVNDRGETLHVWDVPYSKAFSQPTLDKSMVPDNQINLRRAHVFPDGDLLALYETPTNTPAGMGICRYSRSGNPVWQLDINAHHDFALDQDGTIYTLTHRLKTPDDPRSYFQGRVCLEDYLAVVSADGKLVDEFSLLQLYYDSPHYRPDILKRDHTGDLLHTNSVNLVGPGFASHYSEIEPGFLMVCFRNLNLVAVVDPDARRIVWAISGPWHFPHDPDPLDNGNVMIFDNAYDRMTFVGSRVVEFDPRTSQVAWQTIGPEDQPMRSDIRSTQQLLDNGNILICDSNGGRILEVNRDQELVWQFIHPRRVEHDGRTLLPVMTGVARYRSGEIPFSSLPPSSVEPETADINITAR